ncbi:hypothetical protein BKA93DRAFT_578772 [Sparassis latifolia]
MSLGYFFLCCSCMYLTRPSIYALCFKICGMLERLTHKSVWQLSILDAHKRMQCNRVRKAGFSILRLAIQVLLFIGTLNLLVGVLVAEHRGCALGLRTSALPSSQNSNNPNCTPSIPCMRRVRVVPSVSSTRRHDWTVISLFPARQIDPNVGFRAASVPRGNVGNISPDEELHRLRPVSNCNMDRPYCNCSSADTKRTRRARRVRNAAYPLLDVHTSHTRHA